MVIEESAYKGKYLAGQGFQHRMFHCIIKHIAKDFRSGKLLDIGCGNGSLTKKFASIKSFPTVVGVDTDATDIQLAKKTLPSGQFIAAPIESLEIDTKFDTIVMFQTIEHLVDPVAVLKKVKSMMAPLGGLLLTTINAYSLNRRLGMAMGMIKHCSDLTENDILVGHQRIYDQDMLRQDLFTAGFRGYEVQGMFFKPFSNAQMELYSDDVIEGLYKVGKELPVDYCALLYAKCKVEEE